MPSLLANEIDKVEIVELIRTVLERLMKETEAVHPVDTSAKMRRKIKPKGVESTRRSDR